MGLEILGIVVREIERGLKRYEELSSREKRTNEEEDELDNLHTLLGEAGLLEEEWGNNQTT